MDKRARAPRTRWGEPDKTSGVGFSIASRTYEGSPRPPRQTCERCHAHAAEILVVGEREGMAVRICRSCRETRRFPMSLMPRSGRRRS
jgi:hypothetical protein